ncbi:hypothetical protein VNI00_002494 [Paramarasmius palmivorus]|uniref:Uncharacterized protein n=1 Tax=Paramarasmius palmivorus TaxID=297713 RepID=A0AAW0DXZ1_9AGAR
MNRSFTTSTFPSPLGLKGPPLDRLINVLLTQLSITLFWSFVSHGDQGGICAQNLYHCQISDLRALHISQPISDWSSSRKRLRPSVGATNTIPPAFSQKEMVITTRPTSTNRQYDKMEASRPTYHTNMLTATKLPIPMRMVYALQQVARQKAKFDEKSLVTSVIDEALTLQ